jgi:glycosyltransferase involved in cell wall biosynthesis
LQKVGTLSSLPSPVPQPDRSQPLRRPSAPPLPTTEVARPVPIPTPSPDRPAVSALVTCFNESAHIAACIESLLWCDEILVVDSYSTDNTVEIARRYDKVKVLERRYYGGASQKNWAIPRLSHDWVLILDADERITPALRSEIEKTVASATEPTAFTIKRRTFFLGREIRYSGWQHDRVVRLFEKSSARYPNRRVHADMETRCPTHVLEEPLEHYMVDDLSEYAQRLGRYANWGAAQLWRDGRRSGPYEVLVRPAWRFFRTYLLQRGIVEGLPGLIMCSMHAYGTFLKWATLWSWHSNARRGRQPNLPEFDDNETTWSWSDQNSEF